MSYLVSVLWIPYSTFLSTLHLPFLCPFPLCFLFLFQPNQLTSSSIQYFFPIQKILLTLLLFHSNNLNATQNFEDSFFLWQKEWMVCNFQPKGIHSILQRKWNTIIHWISTCKFSRYVATNKEGRAGHWGAGQGQENTEKSRSLLILLSKFVSRKKIILWRAK